jgi:hypothetical protein
MKNIEGFNKDGFNLNYHANDTFAQVHMDPNRFQFIRGPVGSGKSSGCIWHIVLNAMKQQPDYEGKRKGRYAVIRATYPSLKTTVVNSWRNWFGPLIKVVYDIPIRGTLEFPAPDGTSTIQIDLIFIALDREEEVRKLQSLELTGAHINETAEVHHAGIFNMLKSRINRYPDMREGGAVDPFIMCDYNSPDTEHWLYKLAEEDRPTKHSFYHQPPAVIFQGFAKNGEPIYINNTLADNRGHEADEDEWIPAGQRFRLPGDDQDRQSEGFFASGIEWVRHLDEDYYLDQIPGTDPAWVNVFLMNNYGMVRKGKPVYPEYDDKEHCAKEKIKPLQGIPITIGMDLGLTPAASFCQLTPLGQIQVFDELVEEDMSIKKFGKDVLLPHIANNYRKWDYNLVIDPSGSKRGEAEAKSAFKVLQKLGLPVMFARTNEPLARREAVVYFLEKRKGFILSPTCKVLRKGFISEYNYPKYSSSALEGRFKPKPDKNMYSHIHDGLQYACLELSEGRVVRTKKTKVQDKYNGPATDAGY